MKKMFYLMTAVIVVLAFNACSIEDNSATPTKLSGRAVITVNTAALYEEIGTTEGMNNALAQNLVLTDSVLVYDENGRLVSKLGKTAKDLKPLTIVADNLPDGTYTLVAWQSAYKDDGEDIYQPYVLSNEKELANVNLSLQESAISYFYAIGIATATVTVGSSAQEVTVTPAFIGSIVDVKPEKDVKEDGYVELDLFRMNKQYSGFYLDPARTEADRWIEKDLEGYAYCIGYIAEGEDHYKHYTLEHGDDMALSLVGWKSYDIDDDYDILIFAANQKLPTANNLVYYFDLSRFSIQPPFCGLAEDLPAWKAERDAGKLVNDPYLKWGGSLAEVEKHMKAKQYWTVGNDKNELWEGMGWHRWYYVASKLTEQYLFETEDGQNLTTAISICHDVDVPREVAHKSLTLQGYTYMGKLQYADTESDIDIYLTADGQTEATIYDNYGGWAILYKPVSADDLDHVVPAVETARKMVRRVAPDTGRGQTFRPCRAAAASNR